jgi:hypothetical protein
VAGGAPRARVPLNPVPNATATRPGASADNIADPEALTIGWRSVGTSTPRPRPIRLVCCAARASMAQTSGLCAGVSNSHARL